MRTPALLVATLLLTPLPAAWGQDAGNKPLPPETEMSHEGWYAELPPALAEAKRTGKDMLIDFGGSDWCAPCKWLKERILTKPEFYERASKQFVLVDIDTLARGLSPERKARYVALQKQYKVGTFPSVFLATPDGEPYAWTTYIPPKDRGSLKEITDSVKTDSPERFWAQLEPLIERGRAFRRGLARADALQGEARVDALVEAMSQVRPDFLQQYYPERIEQLRALDPQDRHGFLAYLAAAKAYNDLELRIGGGYELNPEVRVADVDALIAQHKLTGETLQQALAMKATLLVLEDKPRAALQAIQEFVDAQATRSRFDRGDYMEVTDEIIAILRQRLAEGLARPDDEVAQYLALHRIFENAELPNRYKISCHATETSAFQPIIAVRMPLGDGYGRALLAATASLEGEARARALAQGLKGTFFLNHGVIKTIVSETIPQLAGGAEQAREYLPDEYKRWVRARSQS